MFEAITARAEGLARGRARARREALAQWLAAEVPQGVTVADGESGVRLSGRDLRRRCALDQEMRALLGRLG